MNAMNDFASAVMVRLLAHGMQDLGLDPGEFFHEAPSARVDLQLKRRLLERAVAQGGVRCLPLLGQGVRHLRHEPTHAALTAATGPMGVVPRWQRLERYVHSRHRCVVLDSGLDTLVIEHRSVVAGQAPSAAEHLVVLGVLAALMTEAGTVGVQVQLDEVPVWPIPDATGLGRRVAQGACGRWIFRWSALQAQRLASPPEASMVRPVLPADEAWPATARAVWECLVQDLTHAWDGPGLAKQMGLSWRTLQRHLALAGLSLTRMQAEARCRAGAWRLLHTTDPVAEVGFLSGFSDQPHFTRALRRRVGMTPASYRAAFRLTAGDA